MEPFSELIHTWEKTLTLVYEIIDHWIHFTQRKWLYLEGIFAGNDARSKLPEIATKFDRIDSEYVQVWNRSCRKLFPIAFEDYKRNTIYLLISMNLGSWTTILRSIDIERIG